ncbi:DUF1631 domain-containing protein [Streptacidiphilus carbonis]|uniref:DUF1631 domain-containing protein n=1 Tax=Streptacidiphilus carbonis TaxID=105422 RepID=UPI0013765EE4|nr:DUF1631 domain-containing protein [Streptacidiphilus carbonis]
MVFRAGVWRRGRLKAAVGATALLLLAGIPAGGTARAQEHAQAPARERAQAPAQARPRTLPDACGAAAPQLRPVPAEAAPSPDRTMVLSKESAARSLWYDQAAELPIGLWSDATLMLRAPAAHGTVRLDLTSRGFSTDSVEVQRWVPSQRRWVDLATAASSAAFPTRGSFGFPVSTRATAARPEIVPLRLQSLDQPGRLGVTASFTDGHGHTYRAPAVASAVTRPQTVLSGWPARAALVRGGPAQRFGLTVRNTTDRAYPALTTLFYAYGMGGGRALTPRDLVLQQYVGGRGWVRLPLAAGVCDPGMSTALLPAEGLTLAPGAGETVQLRLAVAKDAPHGAGSASAGLAVRSGDTELASESLPFTVRS